MKRLLLSLLICAPLWATLPSYTTAWNVQSSGDDTNGGCFVTGASGTDFTLQNAAQTSFTDLVAATTTTITSAAHPFSSTDVGNCIHIASGTGWTVGWYSISSVSVVTATVDRAIATMGSTGGTGKEGGALATPKQCGTNMALSTAASCSVKADGTYSIASTVDISPSGPNNGVAVMYGYTTTRTDGGQVTFQAAAGLAGSDFGMVRFTSAPAGSVIANMILDCNNQTFVAAVLVNSNYETIRNAKATNCSDYGYRFNNTGTCDRCITTNTPAAGISGTATSAAFSNNNTNVYCFYCEALGSTVNNKAGFDGWCGGVMVNSISAHFTGTTSDALRCVTQEGDGLTILNLSIYDITRDAIRYSEAQGIDTRPLTIRNLVASNIGGYCLDQVSSLVIKAEAGQAAYTFCNTTGATGFYNNWPAGTGDVTLSTSPFTNGGSNDFSLNSTAGGGAAAKGLGFPGALSVGGTGHLDPGALQSAAPAAGAQIVSAFAQ